MRSLRWAPVAGWCAATATSIVLGSVALMPVLRTASPEDQALPAVGSGSFPAPLPTPSEKDDENTKNPADGGGVGSPSAGDRSAGASDGGFDGTTEDRAGTTGPAGAGGPSRSGGTTRTPGNGTTGGATTTEDGWTVTTAGDGVRTYVRYFRVDGGQAVIKMTSRGVVSLVTATPADGYAVQKVQDSPGNLAVYFNQTNHSFIIHATWWDDRPLAQVSEVGG
ncbi:DNA mismatch repair protein MutL [Actinoplanes sp. TBRC 11911]|uniref:DNA mismatch repair protein MutL n=1 Tax=Actinoplanes sp. TBRC 11911 TaxID=2729386 RepID=UPI00145E85CB|nr:DNA mismatch repair protein MutL [Actinoplanes sp. TBRC 11911]NMO53854.1 DNA mismatch repair protein MutL [Actinoplanes sp. TBRC 11911]